MVEGKITASEVVLNTHKGNTEDIYVMKGEG